MSFLRLRDFNRTINDTQLSQLTGGNDTLRAQAADDAVTTAKQYLTQKYDVSFLFKDTSIFSLSDTYKAGQLVELNYDAYNSTTTYTGVGTDYVINAGKAYVLKTSGATSTFDASKWYLLGNQYETFYIPFPYTQFNYKDFYSVNDKVFYKDKVYKSNSQSSTQSHQTALQAFTTSNIPFINSFPDALNGSSQWGTGVAYSFSGLKTSAVVGDFSAWSSVTTYSSGIRVSYNSIIYKAIAGSTNVAPDSDITKWQPESWISGDNRNTDIIKCVLNLAVYYLHEPIAPRNIPDFRVKLRDDSIAWLKDCALGNVTLDAPLKQPDKGQSIRTGSEVKRQNFW